MVDVLDLPGLTVASGCPEVVWCFWWQGEMNDNRVRALDMMRSNMGVPIILVGADNINDFVVDGFPLHPAFEFLSDVHKSDYIRIYFLHHFGGGWHDIKPTSVSYRDAWSSFNDPDVYLVGKPEIDGGAAQVCDHNGIYMPAVWRELVATNRWIGRAGTPLSQCLYDAINAVLDDNLEMLRKFPARSAYSHIDDKYNSKWFRRYLKRRYPLRWTLFGDVFHPLNYEFRHHVSTLLPYDEVENLGLQYR